MAAQASGAEVNSALSCCMPCFSWQRAPPPPTQQLSNNTFPPLLPTLSHHQASPTSGPTPVEPRCILLKGANTYLPLSPSTNACAPPPLFLLLTGLTHLRPHPRQAPLNAAQRRQHPLFNPFNPPLHSLLFFCCPQASPTSGPTPAEPRCMLLNGAALESLEVLTSSEGGTSGSLLSVLDHCVTPFGRRRLRQWLCRPLFRVDDIVERQDAVEALAGAVAEAAAKARRRLAGA